MRKDRLLLKPILDNLRVNGCAICGSYYRLQFHHVNPKDRKFYVGLSMTSKTNKEIADEINKCILLCQSCHLKIHWNERMFDIIAKCNSVTKGLNSSGDI